MAHPASPQAFRETCPLDLALRKLRGGLDSLSSQRSTFPYLEGRRYVADGGIMILFFRRIYQAIDISKQRFRWKATKPSRCASVR
jgi:hypothetical protein